MASLWRLSDQNKHAKDIVDHGNKLYDKIVGFVDDMKKVHTVKEQCARFPGLDGDLTNS